MNQIIDQHRRKFFGVAAGTVAVGLGVIARAETDAPRSQASNASFGVIKQIDAGVLNVGYAEAGPSNGPVAILLHGWPYDIHAFVDVAPILAKAPRSFSPARRRATASPPQWPSTSSR
jgi:hypothetical protein